MTRARPAGRRRRPSGVVAALLAVLAALALSVGAGTAAATPTATPAACPPEGTVVVVDLGALADRPEDGVRTGCDAAVDDERAGTSIEDAGFDLEHATRNPGFVCRVQGVPTSDPCVNAAPADAYWSLWWAAADGDWVYSSRGVGSLRTPPGGAVALVWHQGDGEAQPPTLAPEEVRGAGAVTNQAGTGNDTVGETGDGSSGALPVWVPAGLLAALLGAGVLVTLRRRRA